LGELIEQVLLAQAEQKLVIFIDEIDSVLSLKEPLDDFFALIKACYNKRSHKPEYNRLTFALLGVATPSDLIRDKTRSPFNIGQAIHLSGLALAEAMPLAQGLVQKTDNQKALLKEILAWTGGQPFLTQKICKLVLMSSLPLTVGDEGAWVENLVRTRVIENWEAFDEPEHLKTIRDRILWSQRKDQLLQLYHQILQQGEVKANELPEQMELRLSGLVVKQQGKLRVYNRIYESIFNRNWVENALDEASLLPKVASKKLAKEGNVESNAIAKLSDSAQLPPTLCDPQTEVRQLAAKFLVAVVGEICTRQGDIEKALAAYAEAQRLNPTLEIPATVGNNLCRWGSLWGFAAEVMDACDTAVALEPENGRFRDSRGLARALTGNIEGAIEDFQAFVDWTDEQERKAKRQRWIEALRVDENPFTKEEIENLFNEYNVAPPEKLEEIEVCQNPISFGEAGRNLAGVGDVEDSAIAVSPSSAPVVPDKLSSESGIDYTRLRDLLAAEQWFEADRETTAIMLRISGREADGWLREQDIEKFPCIDLITIDKLWVKYSKGRFGFSIQKEIWENSGGTENAEYQIYCNFSKRVGWGDGNTSWFYSCDLTFNNTAPFGHLPGGLLNWLWSCYEEVSRFDLWVKRADSTSVLIWWNILSSLAWRLRDCNKRSLAQHQ
jgi:tetratricopeptide (TPR) repeat protein